jgi:uncharacterized membrane protein
MVATILQLVVLLLLPAAAMALEQRSRWLRIIPTVLVCYGAGILLGNMPGVRIDTALSLAVCSGAVALAIPLLLFSVDIVAWFRMARPTVVSFGLCIVSVLVVSIVASFAFRGAVEDAHKVAAMLVGVYTGGTPNMAAIGAALGVPGTTFVKLNSADIVTAAVYLPFLFAVAPRLYGRFLRPYPPGKPAKKIEATEPARASLGSIVLGLLLDLVVVGGAVGASRVLPPDYRDPVSVLAITTAAIALSLHPRVRGLPGTHATGQYILLVFCTAVGTTAQFDELVSSSLVILAYTATVMFGSALLHVALAALCRIDRDTVIITSTAAIFGPAFIGPVAVSLKNRELVVSGISTSLVGLAIGNYAGLFVAWLLSREGVPW